MYGALLSLTHLVTLQPIATSAQSPERQLEVYESQLTSFTSRRDKRLEALNTKYMEGLYRILTHAKAAGDLELALTTQEEIDRFAQLVRSATTESPQLMQPPRPAAFQKLVEGMQRARNGVQQQFDKEHAQIIDAYVGHLKKHGVTLIQANKMAEAKTLQLKINEFEGRKGSGAASSPASKTPYNKIASLSQANKAAVIIRGARSQGSGFIVIMNNQPYIVTNQHVLQGISRMRITLLDGTDLKPVSLQLAHSEDLARMRFSVAQKGSTIHALQPASAMPAIGSSIQVLGNSGGGEVVTRLKGELQGVGPDRIEVSAGFVSGNSGSPILDTQGKVLGVATYVQAETAQGQENWVASGTRFTEARRYGFRLPDEKGWSSAGFSQFASQANLLADLEEYYTDIVQIMQHLRYYTFRGTSSVSLTHVDGTYNKAEAAKKYHNPHWADTISQFYLRYSKAAVNRSGNNRINKSSSDRHDKAIQNDLERYMADALKQLRWAKWGSGFLREQAKMLTEVGGKIDQYIGESFDEKRSQ